jgi:hypothetical protein
MTIKVPVEEGPQTPSKNIRIDAVGNGKVYILDRNMP